MQLTEGIIPGEKKFYEIHTGEQLIVSLIGLFARHKDQDKYMPLQNPVQILYPPFVQLNPSVPTKDYNSKDKGGGSKSLPPTTLLKNQLFPTSNAKAISPT